MPNLKYRPNLFGIQHVCEQNFLRIQYMGLLTLPHEKQMDLHLIINDYSKARISILSVHQGTYTRTLTVRLEFSSVHINLWEVQVYLDAKMAEVTSVKGVKRLKSQYPYPNDLMLLPDEKHQQNLLLGEWLEQCLAARCIHQSQTFTS